MQLIDKNAFGKSTKDGDIELFDIKNKNGVVVQLTNYGARIVTAFTPDKNGVFDDIVIGYDSAEDFINKPNMYYGTTVGRFGNRIANAKFELDGVEYNLHVNNGPNCLHGGKDGFDRKLWDTKIIDESSIEFATVSPDMDEYFPGKLSIRIVYALSDSNELKIEYFAFTDKKTHVNLTNHVYFNLGGNGSGSIEDHLLQIHADQFTPYDEHAVPTGEIRKVEGTPLDFRKLKRIGDEIDSDYEQIVKGAGYDHNFVINEPNPKKAFARVEDPKTGRALEAYTNEPGVQLYTANWLEDTYKSGKKHTRRDAFCLETQHFPDSPNKPEFPSTILDVNEEYYSVCVYKFTTI